MASLGRYKYSSAFSCQLTWLARSHHTAVISHSPTYCSPCFPRSQQTTIRSQYTAAPTLTFSPKPRSITHLTPAMCPTSADLPHCDVNDPRAAQKVGEMARCWVAHEAKTPHCQNTVSKTVSTELCTRHAGEDQMFKESIAPGFVRRLDNRAPQSQLFYPAAPLPADPAQPYAAAGSSRGDPNFVPEPPVQRYDGPPMVDARTGKPVARDHLGYPTQPARPAPGATQPAFPELLRRGDQGQGRRRGSSSRSGTPRAGAGEQGGSDDAFMWQLGG